jgi:hypothetical protein
MKLLTNIFLLIALVAGICRAHAQVQISGKVIESVTGGPLPGATVLVMPSQIGVLTDLDGSYKINIEEGKQTLVVRYVGYETYEEVLKTKSGDSLRRDVSLGITTLEQVEVTAERQAHLESAQMGSTSLDMATIETLPAFLGEVDLLKTLQLLPGVQAAGEGNAGFYVRGGGPDQNLILFDGAPVYNASHLLGFFSVFNNDAIESVKLYKGGMPANYGERLASVIDVQQRRGDMQSFQGRGGIGLISSRATIEGPLQKGKASFLLSGRRTYIDVLTRPFLNDNSTFGGSTYFFYDINGRLDFNLNDGSKLYISSYAGDDAFGFNSAQTEFNTDVEWGNRIISTGWQKRFGDKVLLSVNGAYTGYRFGFRGGQDDFELSVKSNIRDYRLQPDVTIYLGGHRINAGVLYVYHDISPNNSSAVQGETVFDLGKQQQFYSSEGAAWIADEFDISERLRIEAGIRISGFAHRGPFTRYLLDGNGNNRDSTSYSRGETVASYFGWEPRLQMRYKLNSKASIKASFTQNYQYIHLANISPLALPTDVWLPSTDVIKPQLGRQWALGYFRDLASGSIEASIEMFYKDMRNLVEYQENYQPQDAVGNNEDNFLTFGRGYAAGLELFIRKVKGKTTGWLGYTLSRTERQFDALNDGDWFPANYDRTHDLALVVAHKLSDKWTFSGNFVYGTGRPITLPANAYFIENRLTLQYGKRNNVRMVDYHRLDLSATYAVNPMRVVSDPLTGEKRMKRKRVQSSWVFSIYNVYSRLNPFFYYFADEGRIEENTFRVSARQVSLFPILPSVTWNFAF